MTKRVNTRKSYVEYIKYIEEVQAEKFFNKRSSFVDISKSDYEWKKTSPKIIAWYLPQYYQMEVNNKYHGQGFTEWSNTTQCLPKFTGHYQPHVPYDVGYYDLTNIETLKRQAFLAKKYGVYGFAFHWYWFSGERTMEIPPQMLLEHPEIDIQYCFDWATENWTSAWDGGTKEIIFEQKIQREDAKKLMNDLLPFFKDERYIKIDGKPVLSIYRCDMFEKKEFLVFVRELRDIAKREGFSDLYLMLTNRVFEGDVIEWGMDALVEFPPSFVYPLCNRYKYEGYMDSNFKADIFDITSFIKEKKYLRHYKSKEYYRSALVGFDNSARRATSGCQIIMNNTPQMFASWLRGILIENMHIHGTENNMVFINSWNEWAEGSHLEPDMKYGYAYLQAVKDSLEEVESGLDVHVIDRAIERNKKLGIKKNVFHIHCIESMGDILACEPMVGFLKEINPDAEIHWMVRPQYEDVIKFHPEIDKIDLVEHLGESIDRIIKLRKNPENIIIDAHYDKRTSPKTKKIHVNSNNPQVNEKTYLYYGSLLASFCLSAGIPPIDRKPTLYLNKDVRLPDILPKQYIVFHCQSAEATKDWKINNWNILAEKVIKAGYFVVEIGMKQIIKNADKGYVNLTEERDLQVIANVIKHADCFVGIDSGFAHFANSFEVPGVLIFGSYKNFERPQMYTGNYACGINSEIIYAYKSRAENVDVDKVYNAILHRLRCDNV